MAERNMNVLSLFSGIGGLELGLERAGMTVVGQVEKDAYCLRVLAKHWPEVPRHDDVATAVEWWRSEPRPAVHVVCGGFPCQPFSLAGRRKGAEDSRYLWPTLHLVIRELRPAYAVLENVPGLLRAELGTVLGDLAEIGYDAEWDCIPAASVGAPHLRDRIFIVAYPQRELVRVEPVSEFGCGRAPVAVDDGPSRPVADAASNRRGQGRPRRPAGDGAHRSGLTSPGLADADRLPTFRTPIARRQRDHWTTEPDVGRVAHGIPARVDRLRALGNAVVPQVAEHIGRLLMAVA